MKKLVIVYWFNKIPYTNFRLKCVTSSIQPNSPLKWLVNDIYSKTDALIRLKMSGYA